MTNRGGLEGHVDKRPEIACRGPPDITIDSRNHSATAGVCWIASVSPSPASCSWQPSRLLEVHCPQFAKEVRKQSLIGLVMCGEQHLLHTCGDSLPFVRRFHSVSGLHCSEKLAVLRVLRITTSRGLGGYQSICNIIASLKYQLGEATEAWQGDDRRAECARSTCSSTLPACCHRRRLQESGVALRMVLFLTS